MRTFLLTVLLPCLAAAANFQRLHAEQATATSFLKGNWNKYEENYHPNYVLDDDPKTAWVEGVEGDGVGESLTIPLSTLWSARAVRLVIFNGYQKSAALLGANAAPKQLTVTVHGPGGVETARQQLSLERKMGPQSFDIPVSGGLTDVVLTLDSVHPGAKYGDTCLSDVQVFADSDMPYNAAVEQGKHEALLQWKNNRLQVAKYFASLPKNYPYASTHFETKREEQQLSKRYAEFYDVIDPNSGYAHSQGVPAKDFVPLETQVQRGTVEGPLTDADRALLQELDTLVRAGPPKDGRWYSLSSQGRTIRPENFYFPERMEPLLHLADATLFEAKGRGSVKPKLKKMTGYLAGEVLSNLLMIQGSRTEVRKVYFTHTEATFERTTTSTTTNAIALFEGGRLTRMVTLESYLDEDSAADVQEPILSVSVMIPTYTEGKLSRLETTRLTDQPGGFTPRSGIWMTKTTSEAPPGS